MMLFPLYALFIWYLCFKHRRRWQGIVAWLAGTLSIATLAMLDLRIRTWLGFAPNALVSLQLLLWIEAAAVFLMGAAIVIMPRRGAKVPCRKCGYELAGLEHDNPMCPECGQQNAAFKPKPATTKPVTTSTAEPAEPAVSPSLQPVRLSPDA